jgi:hypothetical protein
VLEERLVVSACVEIGSSFAGLAVVADGMLRLAMLAESPCR